MRKNLNPRNTHERNFWTHEIPTKKAFGPTKYSRWQSLVHEEGKVMNFFEGFTTEILKKLLKSDSHLPQNLFLFT